MFGCFWWGFAEHLPAVWAGLERWGDEPQAYCPTHADGFISSGSLPEFNQPVWVGDLVVVKKSNPWSVRFLGCSISSMSKADMRFIDRS